jgi:hypothetical protein
MLKYAALLFNTIALLIYQFFFAEGITVTQTVPASANAGEEFTVELVINKGNTAGFAKLQQDLPAGFTAVQDESKGASFSFSNQSVKFIWMSLPADQEFRIRYKVKVSAGTTGSHVIAGKFSYVSDNVKQSVEINPSTVTIGGASSTPIASNTESNTNKTPEPTATENNTTTNSTSTPENNTASQPVASTTETSSVTAKRTLPASASTEFTVEVLINKGTVSGFAKLIETLPAGFTATALESAGASFTFSDQKVKYVWVSMPTTPEFKISYKVTVSGTSGMQTIDGVFSYIENDQTQKSSLATGSINITGGALATNNTTSEPVKTTEPTTTSGQNTNSSATEVATNNNAASNNTNNSPTNSSNNTAATNTQNNTGSNVSSETARSVSATNITAPQGNVMYKVQVAALRNAVDAGKIASMFNLNQQVNTEMAEGFTKYTVGSHNEYRSARDAREEIKGKGVAGPFVTAYNAGRRITVQEALMISNQKWYR